VPSPPQIDAFRKLSQPAVRAYLDKEVSKEWTDKLMAAVDAYNKGKK
jgi:TRAP-type transport system periplasmic protein